MYVSIDRNRYITVFNVSLVISYLLRLQREIKCSPYPSTIAIGTGINGRHGEQESSTSLQDKPCAVVSTRKHYGREWTFHVILP